jgi:hypothetical protein
MTYTDPWAAAAVSKAESIANLPSTVVVPLSPRAGEFGNDRVVEGTVRKGQLDGQLPGVRVRHYSFDAQRPTKATSITYDLGGVMDDDGNFTANDPRLRNGETRLSTDKRVRVFEFDHGDNTMPMTVVWKAVEAPVERVTIDIPKA